METNTFYEVEEQIYSVTNSGEKHWEKASYPVGTQEKAMILLESLIERVPRNRLRIIQVTSQITVIYPPNNGLHWTGESYQSEQGLPNQR